jgi:hypothetical protein
MNELKFTDQQIKIAVDWWVDQLGRMTSAGDGVLDAFRRAELGSIKQIPTPEQLMIFRLTLTEKLRHYVPDKWSPSSFGVLKTDYEPSHILKEAALEAGIDLRLFPHKSIVWLYPDDGSVEASGGYGADTVQLLPPNSHGK